ncbi:MAG TPA: PQQ-binding-like beta-propeller repeat protein, partial [Myxococcales bacterium]|nr:PQQ-binding-like beta-propeller repeat protein [Myxococcales bacterium]
MPLLCLLAGAASAGDWTFYRHDLQGTANAGEPLTAAEARALTVTRVFRVSGDTYSNPIVANGSLYFTAGDSNVHAIDLSTFQEKWRKKVSAAGPFLPCTPLSRADPVGAPAVVGNTVYVPGGDGVVYGLDAATGATLWQTKIADPPHVGDFLWSSMFPLQGKVYVGVSSLIDCVLVPGRLVALDQASGAVTGTFWGDLNHGPGAGIWTQQAYDAATDRIFATTGTIAKGQTSITQPLADAFVAIDPGTMTAVDHFSPLPNDTFVDDNDFGASPTLYDSPDGRHFVAATDKNGWVYALDRDHLANGIVWQYQISGPGASPDIGESSIVSAPYANGMLFVGGGRTIDNLPGAVAGLDAFTGVQKWLFHPDGYVLAGMTVAGDVLFVCASHSVNGNGTLYALDQATGEVLYTLTAARMFGEPTWANGALYVGDATGAMFELKPDPAGPQPDFDVVMGPLTLKDVAGSSASYTVTVKPKNGFAADVTLSTTRVPLHASATFSPATVSATGTAPYTSTLTVSTDPSISAIFEQVGISGAGGGKTRTAAGWFVVQNFALSAAPATAVQGGTA